MNEKLIHDLQATQHILVSLKAKIEECEDNITEAMVKYSEHNVDDEVLEASRVDDAVAKNLAKCAKINKIANEVSLTIWAIKREIERDVKKK